MDNDATVSAATGSPDQFAATPELAPRSPGYLVPVRCARFALSCLASLVVTVGVWHLVPGTLRTTTDIVGYPVVADFDYVRYFDAYYLIALVFPALAFLAYHVLAWRGPLRKPPEPSPVRPVVVGPTDPAAEPAPRGAPPRASGYLVAAGRLLLPAAAVTLEVSSARPAGATVPTGAGLAAGVAYVAVVLGGGALAARAVGSGLGGPSAGSTPGSPARRAAGLRAAAAVRTGAALVVVPLLFVVSRSTAVTVTADHHVVRYPWLPAWLVVVACAALAGWFGVRVVRARSGRVLRRTEDAVLLGIVGPVVLFLFVATLPGALGHFSGFDDAQGLAGAQLTFHGFFPWKSLLFIHGLLADVFDTGIGMAVFSNSRWGAAAGTSMFVAPATLLVFYAFTVYFARRNRLVVLGVALAVVLGLLGGFQDRFGPAPILLVLFDVMLRRPTKPRCAAFMFALVVEAILTPEVGLLAVGLLATLVAFEWFGRAPRHPLRPAFRRTTLCAAFGAGITVAWACFLAATGALAGFIDYYRIFGPGHAISGAIPTQWSLLHEPSVTIEFFMPVILLVLTMWRSVAKLRGRRPWTTRDWTMVAAASWVVLYYGKGLGRADGGHVAEVFTVTVPLLLLWVIEALQVADSGVARVWARRRTVRIAAPRHLVTVAAIVAVVAVAPASLSSLRHTAVATKEVVVTEPPLTRLGYAIPGAVDVTKVRDLVTLFDRYAGATGPVFDFSNDPGVIYYLVGRVPATRFFHVSMAIPAAAQQILVGELARARPSVVVFNDQENGLPTWDLAQNMVRHYDVSQYILDHYTPLVDADGTLLMLRSDLAAHAPPLPTLEGPTRTADLYFDSASCDWGDSPNFLRVPEEPVAGSGVPVPTRVVATGLTTVRGWAVDRSLSGPSLEVLVVSGGRVVDSTVPNAPRPDVAHSLGVAGTLDSGFLTTLPAMPSPVQLYSLNADGTVTPLVVGGTADPSVATAGTARTVRTADGIVHRVVTPGPRGVVDIAHTVPGLVVALSVPSGTLGTYRWLELGGTPALSPGAVLVTDVLGDPSHQITFNLLPTIGSSAAVQVGSCQQWHGYAPAQVRLVLGSGSRVPTVWLAR